MIASLFMYKAPALVHAHNRYWALIRQHLSERGIDSPKVLRQDNGKLTDWEDPALLFSQTCGMPYRTWLQHKVDLVGTPDYGLEDCQPGYYRSAIVVRANDPRSRFEEFEHAVFAFNNIHSQSGYAAPYWHAHERGFWFRNRLDSGRHVESGRAVAGGQADIAALDAVTWRLMQRYEEFAVGLRVLDWTDPTPGLPYIAAKGMNVCAIHAAVAAAIAELTDTDRESLLIRAIIRIPKEKYLAVQNPLQDATA